ncbi:MAG: hypothetical protein RMY28_020495 [Nostoc sp. ChiSLP01]
MIKLRHKKTFHPVLSPLLYTNSINDCSISLGQDAMNHVSTSGLSVAFFLKYFYQLIRAIAIPKL